MEPKATQKYTKPLYPILNTNQVLFFPKQTLTLNYKTTPNLLFINNVSLQNSQSNQSNQQFYLFITCYIM